MLRVYLIRKRSAAVMSPFDLLVMIFLGSVVAMSSTTKSHAYLGTPFISLHDLFTMASDIFRHTERQYSGPAGTCDRGWSGLSRRLRFGRRAPRLVGL